jgi:hypothetical protein
VERDLGEVISRCHLAIPADLLRVEPHTGKEDRKRISLEGGEQRRQQRLCWVRSSVKKEVGGTRPKRVSDFE